MTTLVAETLALTAAGWAARWDMTEAEALELLRSMRSRTVERRGNLWTIAPAFAATHGRALLDLTLGLELDGDNAVGGRHHLENATQPPSCPAPSTCSRTGPRTFRP